MAYINLPAWMLYKRQLLELPTYDVAARHYQHFHIPRPPVEDPAGSTPGLICWGAAGAMPSAEPMPNVDFNTKTETSRKSENVRIENPDDPSQYVIADRATEITFQGATNTSPPAPNTSTRKQEVEDLLATQGKWVPVGGGTQGTGQETFTYRKEAP